MFRTRLLIIFIAGLTLITSCGKKIVEPTVQFISVTPFGNDSAILTGSVISTGTDDIQYVGFSYSSQPTSDILPNQVLLNGTNGQFSYPVLMPRDSTYYFRCFAVNGFSYAISPNVKYTVPNAAPDSAPCPLNANTIVDNGTSFNITYFNPVGGTINVSDNLGYENVTIYFKMVPVNGIYTTLTDYPFPIGDQNPYEVNISVTQGSFTTYVVNAGGSVYVGVKNGKTTISFCSLSYVSNSVTYSIKGKITY